MYKKLLCILLIQCLLLAGCTARQEADVRPFSEPAPGTEEESPAESRSGIMEEAKKTYLLQDIEIPDPDEALAELLPADGEVIEKLWGTAEGSIYRFVILGTSYHHEDFTGYCVQKLEEPYTEWKNEPLSLDIWNASEPCYPLDYTLAASLSLDGRIHVLLEGEEGYYLGEWSEEKGSSVRELTVGQDIMEMFTQERFNNIAWYVDEKGGIYFTNTNEYQHFDAEQQVHCQSVSTEEGYIWRIVEEPAGHFIYLCGTGAQNVEIGDSFMNVVNNGNQNFLIFQDGEKQPLFAASGDEFLMGLNNQVAFLSETEGFFCNSLGISRFSVTEQQIVKVFDYDGQSYTDEEKGTLQGASIDEKENLILLVTLPDGTRLIRRLAADGTASEKKELELAVTIGDTLLNQLIAKFNKQSDSYKVVLRTPDAGEDWDDYRTRLQAELSAGRGPDLMSSSVINIRSGAKAGYLLDMTEAVAPYKEQMLGAVQNVGVMDDTCFGVPYQCAVNTLVTSKSVVGDRTGWSMEEAMQCMEQSHARAFIGRATEISLFYYMGLLSETNRDLIDWTSRTSHLDSPESVRLLEFATKYADYVTTDMDECTKASDGEVLTMLLYLMSPDDMQLAAAVFQGEEAYIGYPAEDGKSGHLLYGSTLSVNQASPNTEGAMEFIEYLLSEEAQGWMAEQAVTARCSGFPVRKDAMEQIYRYLQENDEEEELNYCGDFVYQPMPLSEEDISKLREIFETARPMGENAQEIYGIVAEELEEDNRGGRSAQQVLDIVQNRAQLYLDESDE